MESIRDKITLHLNDKENILVSGFIAPIEYTQYNFHVKWDELANLRVAEPEKQYPTTIFQSFLPSNAVSLGDCWQIQEGGALNIIKQLYPRSELILDNDKGEYRGLWACLRAYNDAYAEVVFRLHAKFVMNQGNVIPSQFAGLMVIDRHKERIVFFKTYVPQTTLNFKAGWKYDGKNYGAEIGYCPQIELSAGTQPIDVEYTESITQENAENKLISHYYKFHEINWVSLEEALEIAPIKKKPIHAVSIDGPIFDESC